MNNPKFSITPTINNCIAEIERIREVVKSSRILPKQEVVLRFRARIDAVYSSTSIEGNVLNKDQVRKVLGGELVKADERMITEAVNYKKALDWMEKRLEDKKPISLSDALTLHSLVMKDLLPAEKTGNFRPGPVYVVDVIGGKDSVKYTGPESKMVKHLLSDLFRWLNTESNKLHPILKSGILHYEFVSIHPFSDGNGRVTRLITMLYLWLNKYSFRKVLVPDIYYWQNRLAYYRALSRASTYPGRTTADITPWLDYFTYGFLKVAEDLEKEITAVSISKTGETVRLSQDELIMIDFVKQMGKIKLKDVLDILRISKRTAQRRLKELVNKQVITKQGKGKGVYYQLK